VDVDLFVLAIDAITFTTVREVVVNPTTGLAFALTDLPPGQYYIYCGSDEDPSDGICGPNDLYCGAYPTFEQPQPLSVDGGDVANVHFVVGPMSSTATGASTVTGAGTVTGAITTTGAITATGADTATGVDTATGASTDASTVTGANTAAGAGGRTYSRLGPWSRTRSSTSPPRRGTATM
jgi:hypothetical protein